MNFPKTKVLIWRALQYLHYLLRSQSKWTIHSPFVYELTTQVFPHSPSTIGEKLETIRKSYLHNHQLVDVEDFGAGYHDRKQPKIQKKLSEITRSSARKRKQGELLYRIIKHHKPQRFLELGTNLGFSTAYIGYALKELYGSDYQFVSVEGAKNLWLKAQELLASLAIPAMLVHQNFDDYLQQIPANTVLDGVFIDGNHTFSATVRYFTLLKPYLHSGSFIILDDIYWNPPMLEAWNTLYSDPDVTLSLDLYDVGILYWKRPQAKQHFKIWY